MQVPIDLALTRRTGAWCHHVEITIYGSDAAHRSRSGADLVLAMLQPHLQLYLLPAPGTRSHRVRVHLPVSESPVTIYPTFTLNNPTVKARDHVCRPCRIDSQSAI